MEMRIDGGLANRDSGALKSIHRPGWVGLVEGAGLVVFAALMVTLLLRIGRALRTPEQFALLLATAPLAFAAADFLGGFVHWFCDTFFEEDSPLFGSRVIAPFREHHRDPLALTRHGFRQLTGNSCLAVTPILAWGCWGVDPASGAWALVASGAAVFFSLAVISTNLFHCWAHVPDAPRIVRWLQRRRLILTPESHDRHHRAGPGGAYCVTTGWMNSVLDGTGFFGWCERALAMLGFPRSTEEESK